MSIVLVFAKFVTHRSRRGLTTFSTHGWHLACVGFSVIAVALGLVSAELETDPAWWLHLLAAGAMTAGVVILLVDMLADDGRRVRGPDRHRNRFVPYQANG